jgi:outer membrane protein OmpA-like peptidoglycan-associated protein
MRNVFAKTMMMLAAGAFIAGCAGQVKKSDRIANTANPKDEIARLDSEIKEARHRDIDVLAEKELRKSEKYLSEAKEKVADGKKQEKILDDVRYSQAYLDAAVQKAEGQREKLPTLFEARQAAMNAGAMNFKETKKEIQKVDDKLASKSEKLNDLKADQVTDLQKQYMEIERKSVVETRLSAAKAKVEVAQDNKAKKKAPETLRTAEIDLKSAEEVITSNVRNPEGYARAVAKANASANLLSEVMTTIESNGKNMPESAALQMISQNRRIQGLEGEVTGLQSEVSQGQVAQAAAAAKIRQSSQALTEAERTVAMQKALESARKQFSPDEAEAYQQGSALMIRLKKMNFASGRSDLSQQSLGVLAKVSEVAKELNAEDIKVEGHTDSTGTAAKNEEISQKRAESVAEYLRSNGFQQVSAEGHGFEKPLATNKTKEGRAQNRRVDITIVPADSTVE